jgi:hypothetical protein
VTSINSRLEEILAEYASTVADIEQPTKPAARKEFNGRILRPPDQQRACGPPTIGPRA